MARAALAPADAQLRALKRDGSSNVRSSATVPPGLVPPDNSQLKASREKRMEELRSIRQRRMEAIQKMRSMRTQPNSGAGAPADTSASGNTSGSADTSTRQHWRGGDITISVVYAPVNTTVDQSVQRKLAGEFARCAVSSRAYCSVSIESTFLSRRIALILGKRNASPLAWRELG